MTVIQVIDQAVVQSSHGGTSHIRVNATNWYKKHTFIVKATHDKRKDGTQKRNFTVNMKTVTHNDVMTVKVGHGQVRYVYSYKMM